jgi:shikimate dehydrogenase
MHYISAKIGKMKKFAVIGNPINHSLSPQIHSEFARQNSIDLTYEKIMADDDVNFTSTIENLIRDGYSGANVTLPFKGCAAKISTTRTSDVDLTGSANTLSFFNNVIAAHTTDGVGLVNDLTDKIGSISNSSVLLLGAGGAANGVIPSIFSEKISHLYLWNRTIQKSFDMAESWHESFKKVSVMEKIEFNKIDIVINATSAGIDDTSLSPISLNDCHKEIICYDMMYGKQTPFLKNASDNNLTFFDGLGMLVKQAAASFEIWHGLKVESKSVEESLRSILI